MLGLQLERLQLIDGQIAKLNGLIAQAMKPHQDAVIRLAEVPGLGVDSARQVIAEVGVTASTFPSASEFASWVGTCPGKDESAEENRSSRCAKGNKYLRRVLNQAAHAAVRKNGSHFQAVFPASAAATGLSVRHLGNRTSTLPPNLEDLACGSAIHRAKQPTGNANVVE
jgi:transposase